MLNRIGAFNFQERSEIQKFPKVENDEAIIQIPAKLFLREPNHNEEFKYVTVKSWKGLIIFQKAKLVKIFPRKSDTYPLAEIIVKKSKLNQNLNQEYFQITPHQNPTEQVANKTRKDL